MLHRPRPPDGSQLRSPISASVPFPELLTIALSAKQNSLQGIIGDAKLDQSDFMTTQVAKIMKFRKIVQSHSDEIITFQDAVNIWVSQGLAEQFRNDYEMGKYDAPARA